MPSDEAQRHPYTLPDSAARFERPAPAANRSAASSAYRPDRMPSVLEDAVQFPLPEFVRPTTPAGVSADVDYAFAVDPLIDVLWSWGGWPANADITLMVGSESYVRTTDENGFHYWNDVGHDFVVGETITLTSGAFTKSHKVQKLALTSLDQTLDIVKGTSKPGVLVEVWAVDYDSESSVQVTTNAEGGFKAKMAPAGIDLAPGTYGNIGRWDSDGDGTNITWSVPNPCFGVNLNRDYVAGWGWIAGNTAILKVDGTEIATSTIDSSGNVYFDTPDILPGQVVTVSDGVSTKSTTVTLISVTNVDIATDTISGTAGPNSAVYVDTTGTTIFADNTGHWVADLSDYYDVVPGSEGWVRRIDNDGDSSEWRWYAPNPMIDVRPDDDVVQGWQFLPETEVEISVGGNTYYQMTGSDGYFDTGTLDYDIQTGDLVVVSDGTYTKDHTVYPSALTGYDVDADTLTGIAAPDREVGAWACLADVCDWLTTTTDGSGNWTLDFSGVLDIVPNMEGGMWQSDDEDDDTVTHWRIPEPWIGVNYHNRQVWCDQWPTNTSVTLFVDDVEISTIDLDYWGDGGFWGVETEVGQEVTVTGGGFTKSTIVKNISLGGVDQYADTVFGTADAGSELEIWAWSDEEQNGGAMYTTADGPGNWLIDFSANWDIKPGWYGWAQIHDAEDDMTEVSWDIPTPSFVVNPGSDSINARDWTPGYSITLTIGTYTVTKIVNDNGQVDFYPGFDIVAGDLIEMSDGLTDKAHNVLALGFTGYDLEEDTISGYADANTWAHAAVYDGSDWWYQETIADEAGNWVMDFSDQVDLVPGIGGYLDKWDDDQDATIVDWYIPNPSFTVNPYDDTVWGWLWPAFTDVTLSIHGETYTLTTNYWGDVDFGKMDFDIIPGDTLEMSDGITTKTHTVYPLTYPVVDWELDTVSGSTNPGGEVYIWVCTNGDCYGLDDTADAGGAWSVDFTGFIDIAPGSDGGVQQWDPDRDDTRIYWNVPRPGFTVNLNWLYIWGYDWEPGSTLTLNVRGIDVDTTLVDENGNMGFGIDSFNIMPGDTVTVRDVKVTKTHVVRNLALTRVDDKLNKVTGTADPGSSFSVNCDNQENWPSMEVKTDASGVWTADFNTIGVDIYPGSYGYAQWYDEEGPDGGDYTEVRWDVEKPVYPAYLEKLTTSKVTFDWEDTPGATAYKIQLSTKKDFSLLLLNLSVPDSTYAYGTKLANNTIYYWRVKAKVGGLWSGWKPVWQFTSMDPLTKPLLLYPGPKAIITDDNTPTLEWGKVTNGVTYLVQISKLVDFSTTYFKTKVDATELEVTPALPNGKYFWRVRAIDESGGKGPWSEVRWFKIAIP